MLEPNQIGLPHDAPLVSLQDTLAKLDDIIDLAKAGRREEAMQALHEPLNQHSDSPIVLHKAGVVQSVCGAVDQALETFQRVFDLLPAFHYTEIEIGGIHASRGNFEEALRWFERAIQSEPTYVISHLRAAAMHRRLGDHRRALRLLEVAHSLDPTNRLVLDDLADVLIYHSQRQDAAHLYETVVFTPAATSTQQIRYLTLLTELGQYERVIAAAARMDTSRAEDIHFLAALLTGQSRLAIRYDREHVIEAAKAKEASAVWRSAEATMSELKQAIVERRPFSLIRLGDGEGRLLASWDASVAQDMTVAERDTMGGSIWHNWFNRDLSREQPEYIDALRRAITASVAQADLVGVTAASRFIVDHRHFGYLAWLNDWVDSLRPPSAHGGLTDALVHLRLHELSPGCAELLGGLDFLGLIGPHEQLAEKLRHRFGIANVVAYPVPGEMRLPDHLRPAGQKPHFPDRYHDLLNEIRVPSRGAVFLIAAGLLGKVYCGRIRELGGIAIDIGSLADAWMGVNTRPGQFDDAAAWTLGEAAAPCPDLPASPEESMVVAERAEQAGDFAKAQSIWADIRRRHPSFAPAYLSAAICARRLRRNDEADRLLRDALERCPDHYRVAIEYAWNAYYRFDFAESLERWGRVNVEFPQATSGPAGIGLSLIKLRRLDEAEVFLQSAVTRFPNDADVAVVLAEVSSARQDWAAAMARWRELRLRFPGHENVERGFSRTAWNLQLEGIDDTQTSDAAPGAAARVPQEVNEIGQVQIERLDDPAARALVLAFESLGENCEFGLVQRHFDAEPLSLLRWTYVHADKLVAMLNARFDGLGELRHTRIELTGWKEYFIVDQKFGLGLHTFINEGEVDADTLLHKQSARVRWLRDRLIESLEDSSKIFMYKFHSAASEDLARQLHAGVRRYGPNTLLCIWQSDMNNPAGSVRQQADGLLYGYIDRVNPVVGPYGESWDILFDQWLSICRNALRLSAGAGA
jgi:tetratricopeptide (TPR) repeat protein